MKKKKGKKYEVHIYCDDCFGDEYGCFDGGYEAIYDDFLDKWSTKPKKFNTRSEAEEAGDEAISNTTPWRYEIVEV